MSDHMLYGTELIKALIQVAGRAIYTYDNGTPNPYAREKAVVESVMGVSEQFKLNLKLADVRSMVKSLGFDEIPDDFDKAGC